MTHPKGSALGLAGLMVSAAALVATLPRLVVPAARAPFGGQVIRFHVIANSDRPADQALKLKVRDVLLPNLASALRGTRTPDEVRQALRADQSRMEDVARGTLRRLGSPDPVRVEVGFFPFPARRSGGVLFPAGTYEAVRVVIGRGAGHNWWCVLYPSMCFVEPGPGAPAAGGRTGGPAVHAFRVVDGMVLADEERLAPVPVEVRSAVADWWAAARYRLGRLRQAASFARWRARNGGPVGADR